MAEFKSSHIDMFLGVVRKYMQVRGPMSQKDLAELTDIGVSTMSRFLNQKTGELNAIVIAKIVAKLKIPLHEIIDFIDEEYSTEFKRLVSFYMQDANFATLPPQYNIESQVEKTKIQTSSKDSIIAAAAASRSLIEQIETLSPRQKAYVMDFLDLDVEGRDLLVDLGNSMFRYFRQKGM